MLHVSPHETHLLAVWGGNHKHATASLMCVLLCLRANEPISLLLKHRQDKSIRLLS